MMSLIKKLTADQIQKIAAGEVVERPVNIVKELVENSLDAQARAITVYIENGGKEFIRVTDNGYGMSQQDALLCFKHHTTSKLSSINDLETVNTFGFRGEALSSIASVSNTIISTKRKCDDIGIKLHLKEGVCVQQESVAIPFGTDIQVKDLFSSIPARKKFLKAKETELRQISIVMHAFALSNLSVHFKVMHNNHTVISCPPASGLTERISQLKQHQLSQNMLTFNAVDKKIQLTGYISNHHFYKYDRSSIYYFVNNRWIKNTTIGRALLKGFQNVLPDGRFPAAALFISIDPDEIDVNIHPKKEEVKFMHPRQVETFITKTVSTTLEDNIASYLKKSNDGLPHVRYSINLPPNPFKESLTTPSIHEYQPAISIKEKSNILTFQHDASLEHINNQLELKSTNVNRTYSLLGQYKKTYLLIEKEEGLLLVDQHAAHERILYELFSQRFHNVPTINLIFPHKTVLSNEYIKLIECHLMLFKNNGIELEIFGKDHVIIHAAPTHLKHVDWNKLLHDSLAAIKECTHSEQKEIATLLNAKLQAQMACKAAVKAGDHLSTQQMYQLIDDLEQTANKLTCPHGRPTCWLFLHYDIEKNFKRRK